MSVRVPPLQPNEWDDDVINALSVMVSPDRIERRDAGIALAAPVRHPTLTRTFTIGSRGLLAMAFNTFGVQIDHDNEQQER